jgi:integrase
MIVLIALTTGMRMAEIFGLARSDLRHTEGLIAVRAKLKGGKIRYVPMTSELASELRKYPAVIGDERLFPPQLGAKSDRQRVEKSFKTLLDLASIREFRFHDLRHTFASWPAKTRTLIGRA